MFFAMREVELRSSSSLRGKECKRASTVCSRFERKVELRSSSSLRGKERKRASTVCSRFERRLLFEEVSEEMINQYLFSPPHTESLLLSRLNNSSRRKSGNFAKISSWLFVLYNKQAYFCE